MEEQALFETLCQNNGIVMHLLALDEWERVTDKEKQMLRYLLDEMTATV
jgi:hypothetical protein